MAHTPTTYALDFSSYGPHMGWTSPVPDLTWVGLLRFLSSPLHIGPELFRSGLPSHRFGVLAVPDFINSRDICSIPCS
ncbi:hypothetical protein Tco_0572314 [Tanacetum coccineum]